jgi:hypothetical protein
MMINDSLFNATIVCILLSSGQSVDEFEFAIRAGARDNHRKLAIEMICADEN